MNTRELVLEKMTNPKSNEMDLNRAINNHLEGVYNNDKSYLIRMKDSLWYGGRGTFSTNRGIRKMLRNAPGNIVKGSLVAGAGFAIGMVLPVAIPTIVGGTTIAIAYDGATTKGFSYMGKIIKSTTDYITSVIADETKKFVHKKWSERGAKSTTVSPDTIRKRVKHEVKDLVGPIGIIERNMVKMRAQIDLANMSISLTNECAGNNEDFHKEALIALEAATASMYYRDKIACIVAGMEASLKNISKDLDTIGANIAKSRDAVRDEIVKQRSVPFRTNIWGDF